MNGPKVGDRVRVEFEDKVVHVPRVSAGAPPIVMLQVGEVTCCVPLDACTVLARPVKVGDVVDTLSALEALPDGSVIAKPGDWAWTLNIDDERARGPRLWHCREYGVRSDAAMPMGCVVLRIGGGAS